MFTPAVIGFLAKTNKAVDAIKGERDTARRAGWVDQVQVLDYQLAAIKEAQKVVCSNPKAITTKLAELNLN